jgi:DNA polymerase-3 subunit chi
MAEVSFYVLSSESLQERFLFACKLIEKAYRSGHFCYVLTDAIKQSQHLDDLLWTFRAGSFIPHQLYAGEAPDFKEVILIGSLDAPEHWQKTIINLSSKCPANFRLAERILEILDNGEETKELGRSRYRFYQQAGISVATYKIGRTAS